MFEATYPIQLLEGGVPIDALVILHSAVRDGEEICGLELQYLGKRLFFEAADYFEALVGVRRTLEAEGLLVNTYGASRNVWPSGMARSMGAGLKACRMTLGKQALRTDLVSIFETGPDIEPVTVDEQATFSNRWFASLGANPSS